MLYDIRKQVLGKATRTRVHCFISFGNPGKRIKSTNELNAPQFIREGDSREANQSNAIEKLIIRTAAVEHNKVEGQ